MVAKDCLQSRLRFLWRVAQLHTHVDCENGLVRGNASREARASATFTGVAASATKASSAEESL